jgi:DNA modification methylase
MTAPAYERFGVTVYAGDCLDVLAELPDASVHAVVTDPPYALPGGFMGKAWDQHDSREDAGFAYWLAGLVDGEGHFAIKQHGRGTHAPFFQLSMRLDEMGTLEQIRRVLGVGTITVVKHEPHDMARWIVQDKAGCQRLVDLFDKYPLRAKKRMDFATWREAVCEWTNRPRGNRWHGGADNSRMAALRTRLMAGRRYVDPPWSGHEFQDWCRLWAAECLRVLKPGGHLLAFGGSRTWHRLTCAVEDAGFEIRDSIAWLYASGFPKSLDVSKAIDKTAGVEREVIGYKPSHRPNVIGARGGSMSGAYTARVETAPATDAAHAWQGWGTALKPGFEPIVVARKPLAGTVAGNVLEHGVGALNIDACRVGAEERVSHAGGSSSLWRVSRVEQGYRDHVTTSIGEASAVTGRWPSNVVLTHAATPHGVDLCGDGCVPGCPVRELDEQAGIRTSGILAAHHERRPKDAGILGAYGSAAGERGYGDSGGASRFFPVFRFEAKAPAAERPRVDGVAHPTVKPLALMRWLVRLVTPPKGCVLDLLAGSGTTGQACRAEGFECVLIERDETYLPLIRARLDGDGDGDLFGGVA